MALNDLPIGAGRSYVLNVQNADGSAKDLTETLLKWSASSGRPKITPRAEIYKTDYPIGGISDINRPAGQVKVSVYVEDVEPLDPVNLCTSLRVHSYDTGIAPVTIGVATLAPGAEGEDYAVITVTSGDLSAVHEGFVLIPAGAQPNNTQPVSIEEIDLDAGTLLTDFLAFTDETSVSFDIYECEPELPASAVDKLPIVRR